MLACPRCKRGLVRVTAKEGVFFECPACHGRSVALAVARRVMERSYANNIWQRVIKGDSRPGAECPSCRHTMSEVGLPLDDGQPLRLDVCARCRLLWFDPHEFDQSSTRPLEPDQARTVIAKLREIGERRGVEKLVERRDFGREPAEGWNWIPAMFGLPVEHEIDAVEEWPWYTWLFAATLVIVAALNFGSEHAVAQHFGLIPAQVWRYGGLTLITSVFLHASLVHAVGNAYFLLIFGDNVEDYIGSYKFLLLLVLAALAGEALHIQGDPDSQVPVVGASGAISGVIVYYALMFPRARLGIFVQYLLAQSWLNFPAYFGLICWLVFQSVMAYLQVQGFGGGAGLESLGGAGVGFCAWLLWRNR